MFVHLFGFTDACVYVYAYCVGKCTCVGMWACMYVCVYICKQVHAGGGLYIMRRGGGIQSWKPFPATPFRGK